jgi:hypothetical protein
MNKVIEERVKCTTTDFYTVRYHPKPSALTGWEQEERIFSGCGAEVHGFILQSDAVISVREW